MTGFPVLRDLGLILVTAAVLLLAARPFRVPPILTYMIGGLILGPLAGLLAVSERIELFSELGVALLLFVVGLELRIDRIRDVGRAAVLAGVTQVGLTFGLGIGLGLLLGFPTTPAALFGLVAAFSSTVVVIKLLDRVGDLGAVYGRVAIGILLVQDVLVAVVLTVLSGLGAGGVEETSSPWVGLGAAFLGLIALTLAGAAAVRWVLHPLYRWLSESIEAVFVISLTWAFAFIVAAEELHVSVELGAFVAGVALAQLPHTDELRRRVHPLVDFFLAVFFVALGARMAPSDMAAYWPAALALSAFVLLFKPALIAALLRGLGQQPRTAFLAGLTLGQVSEFSFIVVGLAIDAGLVESEFLGLVGLSGLITIGVSAVLVPHGRSIAARLGSRAPGLAGAGEVAERGERGGHVVVIGMNTLGRLLVRRFVELGEDVLAVDTDPEKLEGLPAEVMAGNVDHGVMLEEAGIPRAKLVVSALQIEDVNSMLAYRCRRLGVPVSIHAFDPSLADELLEIGADHLMISKHDGIRHMAAALRRLGVYG